MEMETFLEQYLKSRALAHTRRVKVEKLQEMVQKNASNPAPPPVPPKPASYPIPNSAMPYQGFNGGYSGVPYPSYSAMPNPNSYLPR